MSTSTFSDNQVVIKLFDAEIRNEDDITYLTNLLQKHRPALIEKFDRLFAAEKERTNAF